MQNDVGQQHVIYFGTYDLLRKTIKEWRIGKLLLLELGQKALF